MRAKDNTNQSGKLYTLVRACVYSKFIDHSLNLKENVSPTNFLLRLRCRSQGSALNRCQKSKAQKTRFLTFRDCWLTETDNKLYTTTFSTYL